MTINIEHFKERLEKEKTELEKSLGEIGRINPKNKDDWEVAPVAERSRVDSRDEVADWLETMDEREEEEITLEQRLNSVKGALQRIAENKYGICTISGEEIEEDRLEANPAAKTCKKHREEA